MILKLKVKNTFYADEDGNVSTSKNKGDSVYLKKGQVLYCDTERVNYDKNTKEEHYVLFNKKGEPFFKYRVDGVETLNNSLKEIVKNFEVTNFKSLNIGEKPIFYTTEDSNYFIDNVTECFANWDLDVRRFAFPNRTKDYLGILLRQVD